jgi:hypothetical protein
MTIIMIHLASAGETLRGTRGGGVRPLGLSRSPPETIMVESSRIRRRPTRETAPEE